MSPERQTVAPEIRKAVYTSSFIELCTLGVRLGVDLTGATAAQIGHFRDIWHLCLATSASSGQVEPGMVDGGTLRLGTLFDAPGHPDEHHEARAFMTTTQEITRGVIAAQAGRVLLLHAGALANPDTGAAVVFIAPGGMGKTTLARTFGTDLAYITDETVAVTGRGTILPYPKPLSIRRDAHSGVKDETAPGSLGLLPCEVTPWVAGIVVLRREADAGGLLVEPVGLLDALTLVAPETSSLSRLPRPLHRLADLLVDCGGLQVWRYSEARSLRPHVLAITRSER